MGFDRAEAAKLFDFECDVLKRFNRRYLLRPNFTQQWFFGLSQPFFMHYPTQKNDILKERYFTLSELCKLVDEAEWHYWNSHESPKSDAVWEEICDWRMGGAGGAFAVQYFEMVSSLTGISEKKIGAYTSNEGKHLNQYKWR